MTAPSGTREGVPERFEDLVVLLGGDRAEVDDEPPLRDPDEDGQLPRAEPGRGVGLAERRVAQEDPERRERRLRSRPAAGDGDERGRLGLPSERGRRGREPARTLLEERHGRREHRVEGDLGGPPRQVQVERRSERGQDELVGAEGARERVLRAGPHEGGGAEEDPGLRSAERLVPREADEVGALGERLGGDRLVAQARLGEPLGEPAPASKRSGMRASRQSVASSPRETSSVNPTIR